MCILLTCRGIARVHAGDVIFMKENLGGKFKEPLFIRFYILHSVDLKILLIQLTPLQSHKDNMNTLIISHAYI